MGIGEREGALSGSKDKCVKENILPGKRQKLITSLWGREEWQGRTMSKVLACNGLHVSDE